MEAEANISFEEFKNAMCAKHEASLRASMELVRIGNKAFARGSKEPLHKVIHCIARAVVNSNGAAMTLATTGYGNDAAKVVRSMFDGAVTIAYLRLHPDLVDDYIDFFLIRRWKLYEFVLKDDPDSVAQLTTKQVEEMRAGYEQVVPRFRDGKGNLRASWCKVSIRKRAEDAGLGRFYPLFYAQASGMQHCDMTGLAAQASPDSLDIEVAPSERYVLESLSLGFNFAFRVLSDFNDEAKLGLADDLTAVKDYYVSSKPAAAKS